MIESEKEAIIHHISWILTSQKKEENPWFVNEGEKNDENPEYVEEAKKNDENPEHVKEVKNAKKYIILYNQLTKYIHYEYYRHSSLAKAIHKEALENRKLYVNAGEHNDDQNKHCRCQRCRFRIAEHMRWNAYMHVHGYRYGERNDMAKIHNNLVPWDDLSPDDKNKD